MAIKANATTVISNTPTIDFAQLKNHTQIITGLTTTAAGDGFGAAPYPISGVAYNPATFTVTLTYDTNCDCACAPPPQCMCDCVPGG